MCPYTNKSTVSTLANAGEGQDGVRQHPPGPGGRDIQDVRGKGGRRWGGEEREHHVNISKL